MKYIKMIKHALTVSLLTLLVSGCATLESMSLGSPRTITLNGTTYREEEHGAFETWACRGYITGEKVLFEVGRFENPALSEKGFILYDGASSGDATLYSRKGLNLRWDWETAAGSFAFIIKPDGTGLFYDFSDVVEGAATKANDVYKCSRR